jgi:hypothetical protein
MNWHSVLAAAKSTGTVVALVGVIAIVILGGASQTQRRLAAWKKSGRFMDLLKIFSRY